MEESGFSLERDTRHALVCQERGTRNNPIFLHERSHCRLGVLMVKGINIDGCTDLYILRKGNLTVKRYVNEILMPHVIPYITAIRRSFLLMQDNARNHTIRLLENFLEAEIIQHTEWPVCSPDLNIIQPARDSCRRRIQ
ncbi:transposable element Tcb2 transposase [Trichonephila clavipes]|nr:transposable element Tcb2 transposase [Trichonephila clavipes]